MKRDLGEIIFKMCQAMVSNPQLFDVKRIDDKSHIVAYKEFFVANIDGDMSLNYKGKDIELDDLQKTQLKDAFDVVTDWQIDSLVGEIDKLLK
jgi:hypothetical protein